MRRPILLIFCLLLLTLGALWYVKNQQASSLVSSPFPSKFSENEMLSIHFLDIGQGDATLIDFPNDEQMLVDCSIDSRILAALGRHMSPFDRGIDYLVVTHPDSDHYGGCVDVLDRYTIRHIFYTGAKKTDNSYWNFFWDKLHVEGAVYHEVAATSTFEISGTTLIFLYPDHSVSSDDRVPGATKDTGDNNASIVFRLDYGKNSVLFTGDMEAPLENYLLKINSSSLDTDILKVGHHGSQSSSQTSFLEAVTPPYATISAGRNNRYGHPSMRVLKRFERAGSDIYRTDLLGDVTFVLTSDQIFAPAP